MGKVMDDKSFEERYREPPREVSHASLERSGESPYRSIAPCCGGQLLVRRDQATFALVREDNCTRCGQRYSYTDAAINGERLPPAKET